jgi:hypothetical protein
LICLQDKIQKVMQKYIPLVRLWKAFPLWPRVSYKKQELLTHLGFSMWYSNFTFPIVNFSFISSNIPTSPAFYNSHIILMFVPSTMIYWTELSCWFTTYYNKATLLLGWSHRYKNNTIVITVWLTVTKYEYLKWQWIFLFFPRFIFFPLSTTRLLPDYRFYAKMVMDITTLN